MISARKWVAAGSSAAMLAGGLFLGAPMAVAAPGDAACLQASGRFNVALSEAGITAASVAQLEVAMAALSAAEGTYFGLIDTVGAEAGAALDAGYLAFESADEALGEAQARLEAAAPDDAAAIEEATKAVTEAQTVWAAADAEVTRLEEAYETVIDTPEINAAGQAFEAAQAAFEAALAVVALDEAGAAVLLDYFQEFLAACEGQTGAAPIVIPPAPLPAPAPVAVGAAPVQANVGLNIQTAAAPVPEKQPSIALLAGMLAAGVAVPTAVALRMRRLASAGG